MGDTDDILDERKNVSQSAPSAQIGPWRHAAPQSAAECSMSTGICSKNPDKNFVGLRKWSDPGKFLCEMVKVFLFRVPGHLGPTGQIPKVSCERVFGPGKVFQSGIREFFYSGFEGSAARDPE